MGTYEHQAPMPLRGRRQDIDLCIADIVAALNAGGVETVASCCGHGCQPGSIMLADGLTWTYGNMTIQADSPIAAYMSLWDSLHAKAGHGWDANPWVWVYAFERTEKPVAEETKEAKP